MISLLYIIERKEEIHMKSKNFDTMLENLTTLANEIPLLNYKLNCNPQIITTYDLLVNDHKLNNDKLVEVMTKKSIFDDFVIKALFKYGEITMLECVKHSLRILNNHKSKLRIIDTLEGIDIDDIMDEFDVPFLSYNESDTQYYVPEFILYMENPNNLDYDNRICVETTVLDWAYDQWMELKNKSKELTSDKIYELFYQTIYVSILSRLEHQVDEPMTIVKIPTDLSYVVSHDSDMKILRYMWSVIILDMIYYENKTTKRICQLYSKLLFISAYQQVNISMYVDWISRLCMCIHGCKKSPHVQAKLPVICDSLFPCIIESHITGMDDYYMEMLILSVWVNLISRTSDIIKAMDINYSINMKDVMYCIFGGYLSYTQSYFNEDNMLETDYAELLSQFITPSESYNVPTKDYYGIICNDIVFTSVLVESNLPVLVNLILTPNIINCIENLTNNDHYVVISNLINILSNDILSFELLNCIIELSNACTTNRLSSSYDILQHSNKDLCKLNNYILGFQILSKLHPINISKFLMFISEIATPSIVQTICHTMSSNSGSIRKQIKFVDIVNKLYNHRTGLSNKLHDVYNKVVYKAFKSKQSEDSHELSNELRCVIEQFLSNQ